MGFLKQGAREACPAEWGSDSHGGWGAGGQEGDFRCRPQHVMSRNLRKPQKVISSTLANWAGVTASSGHSGTAWVSEGLAPAYSTF